ncbi:MAG: gamma-glutamyltransferase [Actinomycetota bacterium]|nr:gamma-glutamyltransferase [Actinomycetota bacterium]
MPGLARVAVAAPNDLAASAGTRMAADGGNAVDAAVAAAIVTMITEPGLVSLASGGFVTVQPEDGSEPVTIDGWVEMPGRGLAPDRFGRGVHDIHTAYGGGTAMTVGHGAVATPGTLKALDRGHRSYGRLAWTEVLAPGIEAARAGFSLGQATHDYLQYVHLDIFGWHQGSFAVLHDADGTLLPRGAVLHVPHLADSLEQIAADGSETFYSGDLARTITADQDANGGILTLADLQAYDAVERPSLLVDQGGWRLATNPTPAVGGVALAALLAMLDGRPSAGSWNPDELRALVRSQHEVFGFGLGDPEDEQGRTQESRRLLAHALGSASTAHISAVDDLGGACAITVSSGYSSGVLAPGTGIWLNNCLGEHEIVPRGAHALKPGTRLNSNMAPTVGRRGDDGAVLSIGTPGSDRIVSSLAQVLALFVNGGLGLPEAVGHPRLHVRVRDDEDPPVKVDHEEDLELPDGLGLPTRSMPPNSMYFGGVGAAVWSPAGGFTAAGDPRRTGAVAVTGGSAAHSQ